jgi:hypothetical protein
MKLAIILTILFSTFATSSPDLCDEVFLDAAGSPVTDLVGRTLSRYCQWTGPDAPVWDADVCCTIDDDAAHCKVTDSSGRCSTGSSKMFCEYGERTAEGEVVCYQPFPGMCDAGLCVDAAEIPPVGLMTAYLACCGAGGACQWVAVVDVFDCQGELLACDYGIVDEDGTIECWD